MKNIFLFWGIVVKVVTLLGFWRGTLTTKNVEHNDGHCMIVE